jgi:DNA repair protein RadC
MTPTVNAESSPAYNNPSTPAENDDPYDIFTIKQQNVINQAKAIIDAAYLRKSAVLSSPELTRMFLSTHLAHEQFEVFGVLWLDNRHKVLEVVNLFYGTTDGAAVYPRVITTSALAGGQPLVVFDIV